MNKVWCIIFTIFTLIFFFCFFSFEHSWYAASVAISSEQNVLHMVGRVLRFGLVGMRRWQLGTHTLQKLWC